MKPKNFDLHDRIGYKLALAARVNDQLLESQLSVIDLTRQMWCVLIAVGEQQIRQPSEIASYIGINRTSVSRTLREMDSKGYLKRTNASADKRSTEVALTAKGRRLLEKSLPLADDSMLRMNQKLSPQEQRQLEKLLNKFLSGQHSTPPSI